MKKRVKIYKPCFNCGDSTNKYQEGGNFEPHMMYNPETGEGFQAETMQDHIDMAEMGYLHEDEMKEMAAERKAYGGMVRKTLKETFKAGGASAKQNTNINEFAKDRTNGFKSFMANNAKMQIAEEEAMNAYDQFAAQQPMFNWGGSNNMYNMQNQENLALMKMYGSAFNKQKQGVPNAFNQIGDLITGMEYNPYVETKTKTKIMKPYRQEYRQNKRDYNKDVRDWRNSVDGMVSGAAMPEFTFTPGGMDLTARYGTEVPYIDYMNMGGIPVYDQYGGNYVPVMDIPYGEVPKFQKAGNVIPPTDGDYWDYSEDPTKERNNARAQKTFNETFEAVPDEWTYGEMSWDDWSNWAMTDRAAADKYRSDRNKGYWNLSYKDRLNYNPEAKPRNEAEKKEATKTAPKPKVKTQTNTTNTGGTGTGTTGGNANNTQTAAEIADEILDQDNEETKGSTGNVSYDDEFKDTKGTTDGTVQTDQNGNQIFVPRQSFQVGPGTYVNGMPRGFGAGPMIGYNPENTYLDYYKHRGRGFLRPDKTVMKFSHYAPGAMPGMPGMPAGASTGSTASGTASGTNMPSVDDIIARETQGMSDSDARKRARDIRRAERQGLLDDYMTPEEMGVGSGAATDALDPNNPPVVEGQQGAEQAKKEMAESLNAFEEANPNATPEEKKAFLDQAQAEMGEKMKTYRPAQSYTGTMTDFLREGDPNDILTPSAYDQGAMLRTDAEGNEYFRYPGTDYVYKTSVGEDGQSTFEAVEDPETLEKFRNLYPSRSNQGAYYGYDPVQGQSVPRADWIPNEYDEQGNYITEYETDSDYGRKEDEFLKRRAGAGAANINRADYADEQDYYNALAIPDTPFTPEEAAGLGYKPYEGNLRTYTSAEEKDRINNPRRYMSSQEGMQELTNPENKGIGMFTKEGKDGQRQFDYRDMRKEGFKGREIRDIKRQVKDYEDNTSMTGNPALGMSEIENAYADANSARSEREMARQRKMQQYGGSYYNYGGVPMYNMAGTVPGPGEGMVPVEGLDMSQSVFNPIMEGMDENMPTMPYAQPQQYTVSDNMGGEGTPLNMPVIKGPQPTQQKWAETEQQRKLRKFGDPVVNAAKFAPAIMQGIAAVANSFNEPNNQAAIEQMTSADYAMTPNRYYNAGASMGINAVNPMGVTPAKSAPVQYNTYGQYGGQFQLGGTYALNDKEITQILALGGTIEYLD